MGSQAPGSRVGTRTRVEGQELSVCLVYSFCSLERGLLYSGLAAIEGAPCGQRWKGAGGRDWLF